ncbi:MAG: hypothetical protein ACT4O0_20020 [Pseudonocardia sp.]
MIGGKVLDASLIAAYVQGDLAAATWIDVARWSGISFYVPTLALEEVRAVIPAAGAELAELVDHPSVLVHQLTAAAAEQVERRLVDARVFDGMAGHVVHACLERGWPALSADPERLCRVDSTLEIDRI